MQCHTEVAGFGLGFDTRQLNRETSAGGAGLGNQILALAESGFFTNPPESVDPELVVAPLDDIDATLEFRVRSFMEVNCAQCHQPGGGTPTDWDARMTTPLDAAGIISAPVQSSGSLLNGSTLLEPGHVNLSELYRRISILGAGRMPPVGSDVVFEEAVNVMENWIQILPDGELWPGLPGFKSLNWFGRFFDIGDPWIFHDQHGWWFAEGASQRNFFAYDRALGSWLWTSRDFYPWVYQYSQPGSASGRWIWYYREDRTDGRWFWDPDASEYFWVLRSL